MIFIGQDDIYDGVTITTKLLEDEYKENFEKILEDSLVHWKNNRRRGIWFKVAIQDSKFIPILVSHGFIFHHSQPDYVLMNKWIDPKRPSTLPKHLHTVVGAGGVVVDKDGRVLLMKEKRGHYLGWKFPGGLNDPGETVFETAAREVYEETGVKAKAEAVLMISHSSPFQWAGVSDFYFACAMSLKNEEDNVIVPCSTETAAARWFTREELDNLPNNVFRGYHRRLMEAYDKWKASGKKGCHEIRPGLLFVE